MPGNQEIAQILREVAALYEMDNVPFKPRAYEKASQSVGALDEELEVIYRQKGPRGILDIPGIGQGITEHIEEILQTGRLKLHDELIAKRPVNLRELLDLQGVGPKTIKTFYEKLKIRNLHDLEKAVEAHRIQLLQGFGEKSEKELKAALEFRKQVGKRFVLGFIEPFVDDLVQKLSGSGFYKRLEVCGSFRRREETVGDIDILALSPKPREAMANFVNFPGAESVLEYGQTKSEIRLKNGLQIDLRIVPDGSWGAALQYFTGNKAHNIKLRKIAIEKGYKLSEYGLTGRSSRSRKLASFQTEEAIYRTLLLPWIPPELRNDTGEIEVAQANKLPKILPYESLKGDLQVQTDWTDGTESIEKMAWAAMEARLEYICITDHTKSLAMTHGLDEERLMRQMREIDKINRKLKARNPKFQILKGAEVNILKDGRLDIKDQILAKLDVAGVAVHSHFKMSRKDMTKRLTLALSNPHVDVLFHPTTRIIQKRAPVDFDFGEILRAAKKNRAALEIDSYPDRLDLRDTLIREAVSAGVKLTVDSDAHASRHYKFLRFGIAQARRGWAGKADVLNTKNADDLLRYFQNK